MLKSTISRARKHFALAAALSLLPAVAVAQAAPRAVQYTLSIPAPEIHLPHVTARFPTGSKPTVDLMMAVWSPGYYVQENYATHVNDLTASTADGHALQVTETQHSHWRVTTNGAQTVVVSYTLQCDHRSVTGNWVDTTMAIINGPATYTTLADHSKRPQQVAIDLPARWKNTATSLAASPDSVPDHYTAASYDELADSPVIAGNVSFHSFTVAGAKHYLADIGEVPAQWDGAAAATCAGCST